MAGPDLRPRAGLSELTHRLRERGRHITIETAGVVFVEDLACDLMSISPKLSNALGPEGGAPDLEVLARLIDGFDCQLKFVVEGRADLAEIERTVAKLPNVPPQRLLLMPQVGTRAEYVEKAPRVARLCIESGFRFCPRLQTVLWNNTPGR